MKLKNKNYEAVVIGASAGGIEALGIILSMLPATYPLPIIIVLHLPSGQPSFLPEIFQHKIKLKVIEANEKETIMPGTVYFAPPSHHLLIEKNRTFSLNLEAPVFYSRPSIDILFKSASDTYGKNLVGILLTGANVDGASGLKEIRDNQGLAIVQNPIIAEISTMPAAGMSYASPDCVLSLEKIAELLLNLIMEETIETPKYIQDKFEILIVDDVKDNLIALNALLKRDDIEIFQAQSGNEALELMMNHDFCLALLDVRMPIMNGFELAEFMRGTNKTKNIPIIFVTADTHDQANVFKGYENGAVDFLRKPLNPHSVKSKVNVFLELFLQKKKLKKQVEELNIIRKELEEAVSAREVFIAIAGHELRTPLTALKLQSQLRKRKIENNKNIIFTNNDLAIMFETDEKQLEKLNRLVDDMLDASRINSGELTIELENNDMCSIVNSVIEKNLTPLNAAGIQVIQNQCTPINGRWDKFRIEQVITNLLTNVIRYGDGKPLEITVSKKETNVKIVLKDQGIGISEEDIEKIFNKFERVPGTFVKGLGLGLYIVNQIIIAHKGTINVSSTPGLGSTFTIELPLTL